MKHVKNIILEKRIFKKYEKYNDFLVKFFNVYGGGTVKKVTVHEEYNGIYINIQYAGRIAHEDFLHLNKYFEGLEFYFTALSGYSLMFTVENVPQEFFNQVDIEMEAEKYNL